MGNIDITVVRPGSRDKWGDSTGESRHVIRNCVFYPRTSSESTDNRDTVITGITVLVPAGSDIESTDKVEFPDGTRYEVDGMPGSWVSPSSSWKPGMQVDLREVTG